MHRHRAQRYRIEFISNRIGSPILYSIICFFSRWRDGSGYHLKFGYTYAFLLLFGHFAPGSIYEIIICDFQEKEAGVTNSMLRVQILGLDQDPKVRYSPAEDLLQN
jgi:hypothetical protein